MKQLEMTPEQELLMAICNGKVARLTPRTVKVGIPKSSPPPGCIPPVSTCVFVGLIGEEPHELCKWACGPYFVLTFREY